METQLNQPTESTVSKQNKAHTIAFRVTEQQYAHLISFAKAEGYKNLSQWMNQLIKDEIADRVGDGQ